MFADTLLNKCTIVLLPVVGDHSSLVSELLAGRVQVIGCDPANVCRRKVFAEIDRRRETFMAGAGWIRLTENNNFSEP